MPFVLNRILANPLHNLIYLMSMYMRVYHPMQLGRNGIEVHFLPRSKLVCQILIILDGLHLLFVQLTPKLDGRFNILFTTFFVVFKIISSLSSDTIRFFFKLFDGSRINIPPIEYARVIIASYKKYKFAFMSFRICIDRHGNIIIHFPFFLRICKMLDLNRNFFSCSSVGAKDIKITVNIRQGATFLKLTTINKTIRKECL